MTEKTKEDRWGLYNYETGEITPVDRMDTKPMRWEKSYGKALANMLDAGGDDRARVVATLIRRRDMANYVYMTISEIAAKSKVSTKTVNRTLKALEDKNFIIRVRNGKLMFSPHVMRRGETSQGLAVVTMWEQEQKS
jgi:DNA-binding transcriptional ArsR family regulator